MEKRPLRPEDRSRFVCPGDPQVSPDGKTVAFVVQTVDEQNDKALTNIYIVGCSGGLPRQITNSGSDRSPRWSPDGRTLAFISERGGKPALWLIDTTGGEAWCVPTEQRVSSPPVWSPDGARIVFTSSVFSHDALWTPYPGAPANDRKRAVAAASRDETEKDKGSKAPDVKVITRLRHRLDGVGFFGDRRTQVFVLDVPSDRPTKPIKARQLTTGDFDHEAPSWSSDGRRIVFCATRRDDADWLQKSDVWVLDVETGAMEQVLDASGMSTCPVFSPDGKAVMYIGHSGQYRGSTSAEVRWFNLEPGKTATESDVRSFTACLDRPAGGVPSSDVRYAPMVVPPKWSEDGQVFFLLGSEGSTFVYRCAPGSAPQIEAGETGRVIASMSVACGTIAYQSSSGCCPDEIYCQTPEGTRQLTHMNDAFCAELALSCPEAIKYESLDGQSISGWLLKPYGYEEGKAYPLVLHIHGGPHGVYGWSFQFQGQMLASNGFCVLYTNPRGSQGYGQEFARACVLDWGGMDFQDIMAGVDYCIACGIADPEKLGVTGWSYGGYMTCWAITQTQRFKAAITGACVSNRHSFYGTSDIGYSFGEHHFGSTPWEDANKLLERSAIQYIGNMTTPVLILHGEADIRCPVEQAEQFFIAARRLGKQAVLVRYPGEYHAFKKPSNWLDRMERVYSWFSFYLMRQSRD